MRPHALVIASLIIAACDTPSPPMEPEPTEPAAVQAATEGEGSGTAESPTPGIDEEPTEDVPGQAVADGPSPAAEPVDTEPAWGSCVNGEAELVSSWPVVVDGEISSVGDRIASGSLSLAYPFLPADAPFVGTWWCRSADVGTEVALRATVRGVVIGPRWGLATLEPGVDGRPPEPVALNRPAEAALGDWDGSPEAAARTLAAVARCRAPGGTYLTSGAFVFIERLGDDLDVGSVGWLALPSADAGSATDHDAVLHWTAAGRSYQARWRVDPDAPACEPADDAAVDITTTAEGVPTNAAPSLAPANASLDNQPYREHDVARRALLYAAAEERELRTVADWLAFHERLEPFRLGTWRTEPSDDPEAFVNRLQIQTGDETHELAWSVDPVSGATRPEGRLARLTRRVLPRRLPGVGRAELRGDGLTVEELDSVVQDSWEDLYGCMSRTGADTVTLRWRVQWDGHAYGVVAEGGDDPHRLTRCAADVASEWRFPVFAGNEYAAATTLTAP